MASGIVLVIWIEKQRQTQTFKDIRLDSGKTSKEVSLSLQSAYSFLQISNLLLILAEM